MRKYLPYIVIIIFSLLSSVLRVFVFTRWEWKDHIGAFFFQAILLTVVWFTVRALNRYFNKRLPFQRSALKRIAVQTLTSVLLTAPLFFVFNLLSKAFFPHLEFMGREFRALVIVLFVIVLVLTNLAFYALYFFEQWKMSVQEKARLQVLAADAEKEKSIMQYQHLKNQVNPHFLFNTLTSLDGLIISNPELASEFVRHLSKVYRYVLEHSESEVVTLQTEVDFIQHYISVLKMKHNGALNIQLTVSPEAKEKGIAMVTLQMLIDNAIKHNVVHVKSPLTIFIQDENGMLSVKNNKQLRRQIEVSTKHGLRHLQQLYTFLTPQPVLVTDEGSFFEVKLPLL